MKRKLGSGLAFILLLLFFHNPTHGRIVNIKFLSNLLHAAPREVCVLRPDQSQPDSPIADNQLILFNF